VHNNGLTRQRTFGKRVTRRGDRCRGEKVKWHDAAAAVYRRWIVLAARH